MKRILLAATAAVLIGGPAIAADMAVKAPVKAPPPPPVFSWTGCYIGANVGGEWSSSNTVSFSRTDTSTGGVGSVFASQTGLIDQSLSRGSSVIGGGQVGCNWQSSAIVWGVETDIQGLSAARSFQYTSASPAFTINVNERTNWLGTVRGRVGFTPSPAFLLYATGGLAYGQSNLTLETIFPTASPAENGCSGTVAGGVPTCTTNRRTSFGWTVGVGGEYAFTNSLSAKIEYLYFDLGRNSATVTYNYGANTSTLTASARDTGNIVRVGLNWRFGSTP
jgi:outer membrane immunogenic protein